MAVDFGKTANDYVKYRAGFPDSVFDILASRGIIAPRMKAVDLGTGTGVVARALVERGLHVVGVDPSAELLAAARKHGPKSIIYVEGSAESTGLEQLSFDVAIAGQCWHWLDGVAAGREAYRLLKPGGCLAIAHRDWIELPDNVPGQTSALMEKFNSDERAWLPERLSLRSGIYPRWFSDLRMTGFGEIESCTFDFTLPFSHDEWRGRMRACSKIGASLPAAAAERFDSELEALLEKQFPAEPLIIPHRAFLVWGRKPSA
ncbi:MAG: methyltransferase domain-containing protein [Deltaproteobacteria bacterium]|nr:methyltransferase domain-containing protein [Deltaproteobacteria bacterium]